MFLVRTRNDHQVTYPTLFDSDKIRRQFDRTHDGSDFYVMNVYHIHDFKCFYKKTWPKNSKGSKSGTQKYCIGLLRRFDQKAR